MKQLAQILLIPACLVWSLNAQAQQPAGPRNEPIAAKHWEFDARFQHNRYYPARGYVVASLPTGSMSVLFGAETFFFQAGVWFRAQGAGFIVVDPPLGIVTPVMPPSCVVVTAGSQTLCYANGAYYQSQPTGGYAVVSAPAQSVNVPTPTNLPQGLPAPVQVPAHAQLPDPVMYPRNGQDATRQTADRNECQRWAQSVPGSAQDTSVMARALGACLDAHGYTVR